MFSFQIKLSKQANQNSETGIETLSFNLVQKRNCNIQEINKANEGTAQESEILFTLLMKNKVRFSWHCHFKSLVLSEIFFQKFQTVLTYLQEW